MNLYLEASRDAELCWQISQHPAVVEGVTNDQWAALKPEVRRAHVWLLAKKPENTVLLVRDADQHGLTVGCFLFDQTEPGTLEVHTMLLPACRGMHAINIGKQAAKLMLERDGIERLVSQCPMKCRQILFYALKCGFHKTGEALKTWLKAGELYPLQLVELNKKDLCLSQ